MVNPGPPFIRIIIPAIAGIIAARFTEFPLWMILSIAMAVFIVAYFLRDRNTGGLAVWLAIFGFFLAISYASRPMADIPSGMRVEVVAQVSERPVVKGRWLSTTARVGYYRIADEATRKWIGTDETIELNIDTCYRTTEGEQLAVRGWLNPIDTTGSSYGRLMRLRGRHSRMYVTPGNLIRTAPHISRTPSYLASSLQQAAVERLSRLDLPVEDKAVVTAMTAGDKRGISRSLRGDYASTGAAHLLAVSGLHVGIVFLLINIFLYLMPAFYRGHIYKSVAAIIAIWLYAAMAGLSPSVVRAALMLSFAQVAVATGSARNAMNVMLGSAVVMLALNPNLWGDPSFMLSYAAVLSITAFFPPVFDLVRSRNKILNVLWSVLIVGFTASLGTAPLVAYWFGNFPIAGMLINPVVMVTAHLTVMFGIIWVILPFQFWQPVFSSVLGFSSGFQNTVVEWSAAQWWASVPVDVPLWGVIAAYGIYVLAAVITNRRAETGNDQMLGPS